MRWFMFVYSRTISSLSLRTWECRVRSEWISEGGEEHPSSSTFLQAFNWFTFLDHA